MTPPLNNGNSTNTPPPPPMPPTRTSARLQGIPPPPPPPPPFKNIQPAPTQPAPQPPPPELSRLAQTPATIRLGPSPPTQAQQMSAHQLTMEPINVDDQPENAYPNASDDPDPAPKDASKQTMDDKAKELREYGQEMLEAYRETTMTGEALWIDFLTAFRPHTIKSWKRPFLAKFTSFLVDRGINISQCRERGKAQCLVDLLYRDSHILLSQTLPVTSKASRNPKGAEKTDRHRSARPLPHYNDTPQDSIPDPKAPQDAHHTSSHPAPDGGPSDDDDSTPSDQGDYPARGNVHHLFPGGYNGRVRDDQVQGHNHDHQRGLGMNGLMKAYVGKATFTGGWDEDLDGCIGVYETLSKMCEVTSEEMFRSLPVMLSGDALTYFSSNTGHCTTYAESINVLRKWYNSEEKMARILTAWQGMYLSKAMQESASESEVSVFRSFVAKLMALQKQLDAPYQTDSVLRDRLLDAVDLPAIQRTLRDRMPRSSQQAVHRVANQLSNQPRSAGSASACVAHHHDDDEDENEPPPEAMYSLGKTFGGDARRNPKTPWTTGQNKGRTNRSYKNNSREGKAKWKNNRRRLSPDWMRGVKGCFVCGKDHRANTRHSREEVTAAVNKLKEKHPRAMITVEDLSAVVNMALGDSGDDQESDDYAQWANDDDEEDSDLAYITMDDAADIERTLANSAFVHGRSHPSDAASALATMYRHLQKGVGAEFDGVRLDTAANRRSVMARSQLEAYKREFGLKTPIRPSTRKGLKGIGGFGKVVGEARIQIPFAALGMVIDVVFSILVEDVPSLLSNRDMITNGLDISLQGRFIHVDDKRQPLTLENYFLVYRWSSTTTPFALYTENELRKIHRGFGHPSVRATHKLLKRASGQELSKEKERHLQKIQDDCKPCQEFAGKPRRFKLTIGSGQLQFNNRIIVDTMFIENRPVIHIVDESTHFQAASFLRTQSADEIWKSICRLWIYAYMGPPDFLAVDQGSAYVSRAMKESLSAAGVTMEEAPIETPGSIGTVERYHAPLRCAYNKIRSSLNKSDTTDAECLHMAVYATNATIGPEGLCPMLLVFGALPRPARIHPSPTQLQRQRAIEESMTLVSKEQARRRIAFALRHPGGPKALEQSNRLRNLPSGSPVLVYRTKSKRWEGPFRYIAVEGETAVVQLERGRRIFRTTCVKPWRRSILNDDPDQPLKKDQEADSRNEDKGNDDGSIWAARPTTHQGSKEQDIDTDLNAGEPRKVTVRKGSREEQSFMQPRLDELKGLLNDGTFEPVRLSEIPGTPRIFGSRFVDELKRAGEGLRKKSRLVAQNYADMGAASIATKAPTVQRFSQRFALSLTSSMGLMTPFTRDITQAYIQSHSRLERDVYMKPPRELGLPDSHVLRVVKPLYGIPESGLHWYVTYLSHHIDTLQMRRARADPCVMYRRSEGRLDGLIMLQVDDSLGLASEAFLHEEEKASSAFRCKPRAHISDGPTPFNGMVISMDQDRIISATQREKVDRLRPARTEKEFASQRAMAQYIGVNIRPDVCAAVQLIAPGNKPTTKDEFKSLEKAIAFLHKTRDQGLTFVPLDLPSARMVLLTDASFANAEGMKSQLGYVLLLVDDGGRCNIVHYGSNKCRRIARSVMAAEIHALVHGFDIAFLVRDLAEELMGRPVRIEAMVDSKTVFDVIAKDGQTAEKRLQIDVLALRQSYDRGELEKIAWIPGTCNPADALTKPTLSIRSALYDIMRTNRFTLAPEGWATSRAN